jgi:hypothetical protein
VDTPTKTCSHCKTTKPLDSFHKKSDAKDNRAPYCKDCKKIIAYEYRQNNIEKERQRCRNRRRNNPEYTRNYLRDYQKKHKERLRVYFHEYYVAHDIEIKDRTTQYKIDNPEKIKTFTHNRMANKRKLPNDFAEADWQRALNYFEHKCAICGRPAGLWHTIAADHWVALADPRPNNPGTVAWNILPLCHGQDGCNNAKGKRDAIEWVVSKFGPRKAKRILVRIDTYFAWTKQFHDNPLVTDDQ